MIDREQLEAAGYTVYDPNEPPFRRVDYRKAVKDGSTTLYTIAIEVLQALPGDPPGGATFTATAHIFSEHYPTFDMSVSGSAATRDINRIERLFQAAYNNLSGLPAKR